MPIEQSEANFNIKGLLIPRPSRAEGMSSFDPFNELSPDTYQAILDDIEKNVAKDVSLGLGVEEAAMLRYFFPTEIDLWKSQSKYRLIPSRLEKIAKNLNDVYSIEYVRLITNSFLLYPNIDDNYEINPYGISSISAFLEGLQHSALLAEDPVMVARVAISVALQNPDRLYRIQTKKLKAFLLEQIDLYTASDDTENHAVIRSDYLATLKLLFPMSFSKVSPQSYWMQLQRSLDAARSEEHWNEFLRLLYNMNIIRSEKGEITEEGLKLTFPSEHALTRGEDYPFPSIRQF